MGQRDGAAVFVLIAALGFVGCEQVTTSNGETTKSTIDILKLLGGPVLAFLGLRLVVEGRSHQGEGRLHVSITGAAMLVVAVALFVWGILLL